jgi:protein-disulfide isomerase
MSMKNLMWVGVLVSLAACSRNEPPAQAPNQTPAPSAATAPSPAAEPQLPPNPPVPMNLVGNLVRAHSPVLGPAGAPVTIVEFLDPACEACRAFSPVVKQVMFLHPDDVRLVVRFAAFHHGSDEAIRLLFAAQKQGKFEPVLAALFDGQDDWAAHHQPEPERAWQLAAKAGLDVKRARRDAASAAADALLKQDAEDIVALQVSRTPTFFVNGRLLTDFGPQPLMDLVAYEVNRTRGMSPN